MLILLPAQFFITFIFSLSLLCPRDFKTLVYFSCNSIDWVKLKPSTLVSVFGAFVNVLPLMPTQWLKLMRFQSVHLNLLCWISPGKWVAPEIYNFSVKWRHDKKSGSHTLLSATFYFLKNFMFACCFFSFIPLNGWQNPTWLKNGAPTFFLTWFFNIFFFEYF